MILSINLPFQQMEIITVYLLIVWSIKTVSQFILILLKSLNDEADLENWPDIECAPTNERTFGEKENSNHESRFEHLLEEGKRIEIS